VKNVKQSFFITDYVIVSLSDVGQIDNRVKPLCRPAEDSASTSTVGSKMGRCDAGRYEGVSRAVLQYGDTEVASQAYVLADDKVAPQDELPVGDGAEQV